MRRATSGHGTSRRSRRRLGAAGYLTISNNLTIDQERARRDRPDAVISHAQGIGRDGWKAASDRLRQPNRMAAAVWVLDDMRHDIEAVTIEQRSIFGFAQASVI